MQCNEVQDQLDELAAGLLPDPEREAVEAHSASCASCKEGLRQARSLALLLDAAPLPQLPDSFFERQRQAVMRRLSPEVDWEAPKLSLLLLATAVSGYIYFSMDPLMASLAAIFEASGQAWASMREIAPLYGLLLLLAFSSFAKEPVEARLEVRR